VSPNTADTSVSGGLVDVVLAVFCYGASLQRSVTAFAPEVLVDLPAAGAAAHARCGYPINPGDGSAGARAEARNPASSTLDGDSGRRDTLLLVLGPRRCG